MRFALALALAGGLGMGLLSSTGMAQQPPGERPPLNAAFFERLDSDGDGTITLSEIPEERRERAARLIELLDSDQDGKVTRKEFDTGAERLKSVGQPPRPGDQPGNPSSRAARPGQAPGRPGDWPAPGEPPPPGSPGRPPFGGPDLFRALDTDRDEKLSKDEMARAAETLMKLDRNGDGSLTPEELAEGLRGDSPPQPPGRPSTAPGAPPQAGRAVDGMMRRADKNGDKKISKDEAPEMLRARFDELDGNKDGLIDKNELEKVGDRVRRMREQGGDPLRRPGGAPPGAAGSRPGEDVNDRNRERVAGMMRQHDKDTDGRISAQEFGPDRAELFKRIDSDGDGFLTPNEIARSQSDRPGDDSREREGQRPERKEKD